MLPNVFLQPQMEQVLALLSSGRTIDQAAAAVGIDRNTIVNWRRTSAVFQWCWHSMQHAQAKYWRDQLKTLAPAAFETARQILEDPKVAPSVRLRAALALIKHADQDARAKTRTPGPQPGRRSRTPRSPKPLS